MTTFDEKAKEQIEIIKTICFYNKGNPDVMDLDLKLVIKGIAQWAVRSVMIEKIEFSETPSEEFQKGVDYAIEQSKQFAINAGIIAE